MKFFPDLNPALLAAPSRAKASVVSRRKSPVLLAGRPRSTFTTAPLQARTLRLEPACSAVAAAPVAPTHPAATGRLRCRQPAVPQPRCRKTTRHRFQSRAKPAAASCQPAARPRLLPRHRLSRFPVCATPRRPLRLVAPAKPEPDRSHLQKSRPRAASAPVNRVLHPHRSHIPQPVVPTARARLVAMPDDCSATCRRLRPSLPSRPEAGARAGADPLSRSAARPLASLPSAGETRILDGRHRRTCGWLARAGAAGNRPTHQLMTSAVGAALWSDRNRHQAGQGRIAVENSPFLDQAARSHRPPRPTTR